MPQALPPGYYLDNFEGVLREVDRRYRDLLAPEEADRLDRFLELPEPARRLYVRMLTRQGPWFRPESFRYPEIPEIPTALEILIKQDFCASSDQASLNELVDLLRKDEISDRLRQHGIPAARSLPRPVLAERLVEGVPPEFLQAELAASLGAVAALAQDWARLLCFLYFGNGEQDLSAFILADLGRVQYESYPVEPGDRLFQTRAEVDSLLTLRELRDTLEAAAGLDLEPLTAELLALEPSPGVRQQRRYHRLLNDLGREWERRRDPARALACYLRSQRPPARERRVRILAGLERLEEAAALALEIAASPAEVGEERFARLWLRRAAPRVAAAASWLRAHPEPPPVPELRLTLPRHPSGSVELAVLEAAAADGWEGFFCENLLWNALFGLALWEQLFAPVPGAFHHRLQSAPADLGSPEFYARRAGAIEARLAQLRAEGALAPAIRATFRAKQGLANAFVNWRALSADLLEAALETLPAAAILSVLRTMAPNPLAFDSGFPDLLLVKRAQRACRLWEVKGPGDSLRPEQERWLKHFNQAGVEARIAWVKYLDP